MSQANSSESKTSQLPANSSRTKIHQIDYELIKNPTDRTAVRPTAALPPSACGSGKLLVKLSAEKISLKKEQQLLAAPASSDSLRRKSAPTLLPAPQLLSFSIAPKSALPVHTLQTGATKLPQPTSSASSVKRSRTLGNCSVSKRCVAGVALPPPAPLLPTNIQVLAEVHERLRDTSQVACTAANDSSNSETSSQPSTLGGGSTSPESLLDNILSGASSVSVQSNSSASDATVAPSSLPTVQFVTQSTSTTVPLQANRLLTLKASPQLRVSPPTPPDNIEAMPPAILSRPALEIYAADSLQSLSRSPSSTQSLTPSVKMRTTSDIIISYPEDLKCGICLDVYTDPRTLHCLHSFCFQCLVDENFKQDSTQWAQSTQEMSEAGNETPPDRSTYSLRSSTPESMLPAGSSSMELAAVSPSRQRGATFSLRRKKSVDRVLLQSKIDGKLSMRVRERPRCIACHSCKFLTELPLGGVRQLPQNYLLVRRIEALRLRAGEDVISRVWCSLCSEEINATYHCITCTLNLCTLCKEAHERQRSTASHRMKNIMELRRARKQKQQQLGLGDNTKMILKCSLHVSFDLKAFCVSCQQLACSDCLVLLHKNHKHETISRAINQHSKLLREAADRTRPLCNYAEHSIERLNEIARSINRRCDDIQSQVEGYMQRYCNALEAHRRTLLQQVSRARESKVEMILEQQLDLEKRTQEALDVVRFCQELCDTGADVEILSFVSILLKRFEYCQQFKAPVDPKISDSLHFLPNTRAPATRDQYDIPLFGIITMQTVEPTLCTLQWEGFSQLRLHKKVELLLQSRDGDGVTLCHGGLQINCMVKYKESGSKFLPVEVSDHRDGTYSVCFTPDTQGTLILTISINEKPIKSSPFTFQARQVRPHSGIYHCCAFCSSKGNKLSKCSCEGRMPGYSGCGHGHAGHPGRRHWSCCGNVLENSECSVANKLLNV